VIYLDTNVLLYATLTHVDTLSQQDKATGILKDVRIFFLDFIGKFGEGDKRTHQTIKARKYE